jgi:hypothetical protein
MGDATKIGCRGLEFEYGGLFQARRARRGPDSTLLPFHPPGRNADPTPHMDRPPVSRVKTPIHQIACMHLIAAEHPSQLRCA